ncbi:unnamed protein product [Lepeophtheirus salmonis]|uniref:(salmon louse) hypothetical protein n=1 Tax=Lepeophtheirus salmonis TaxID=72036 RepID=A0A7R8CSF7_LEPSM|nr:unnamed protein product [Lepeophtheirus salmonis]CAF2864511.1 unnamed protein product [Lepeophtheirus salmonis]
MKKNVEKVTPKSFDTPNLKLPIPPKYGNPKSCEGSSVNIRDVAKVEKISKSNNLTGMSKSPTHVVSKDRPLTFKPNQLFLKDSYKPEGIKISDVSIDKKKNSLNGSRQKFIKLEEGICEQQPTHIHAGFVRQRTLDFEKRISEINKSERPLLNDSKPTNKKLPNSIIKKTHNCSSSQNNDEIMDQPDLTVYTYEHNRRPTSSQNNNDVPKTNNENGVYHMHKSISKSWNSRNNSQTETETVKFNCEKKRKDLSNYEYSNVTHPNDQKQSKEIKFGENTCRCNASYYLNKGHSFNQNIFATIKTIIDRESIGLSRMG